MPKHITVLQSEAVRALHLAPGCVVVDATLGSGGHAHHIRSLLRGAGTLIAIDIDPEATKAFKRDAEAAGEEVIVRTGNFRDITALVHKAGFTSVDAILADLGWRIEQFEEGGKGFSFKHDEPLLMTLGDPESYPFTARDIINEWDEATLQNILVGYGEERFARRIAAAIVRERKIHPIERSVQLSEVVRNAIPVRFQKGKIHPATRTFQALRIAVNDELSALGDFIDQSIGLLKEGGRLVIITFHSIEDRIVKQSFKEHEKRGSGMIRTKKPITATREEISRNPRARSAKMRIFEKHEQTNEQSTL